METLIDMLKNSVNLYCENIAFKIKKESVTNFAQLNDSIIDNSKGGKFISISYLELYDKIGDFGTGLLDIGIKSFEHIGLISSNRLEWILSDLAIIGLRATDIPCSENSTIQDIIFKLNHADCTSVILEDKKQFNKFYRAIDKFPNIKNVIIIDKFDLPHNINSDKNYYFFQDILENGERLTLEGDLSFFEISKSAKPDDLITIIYTSGTTDNPKGVMLTHSNLMHSIKYVPNRLGILKKERILSFLPVWHIGERGLEYIALSVGASITYSKPFKGILLSDLKSEKPTVIVCVPRLWEEFYRTIINKRKHMNKIQSKIFNWALNIKARYGWQYQLADRLVYRKIRSFTGGRLKFAISGGAKLPDDVHIFFDKVGINIYEGYALTEAFMISIRKEGDLDGTATKTRT
jgi:long-chain acyl-CoA synthetase